ncbi:hypothetical protein [Ideonella dechloratans]|uniref:hypothetical protein n=1 Tax=Ideonella dechloratans TaxID=36863 RepID=UPI0035AD84E7
MKTFQTLLLREWLQHGRRWWLIALVPLAFGLLGLSLGHVQVGGDASPVATLLITATVYTALLSGVGWLVAYIQSGGLARRDWQDRSIEFWRSLPVSDTAAVGATVLMNLVLLPLLLMVLAIPSGLLAAAVLVGRGLGWSVLASLPWTDVAGPLLAGALRMTLGSLLASFWIAPVALLSMAAAAWLKRWGVPMLWVVWGVGGCHPGQGLWPAPAAADGADLWPAAGQRAAALARPVGGAGGSPGWPAAEPGAAVRPAGAGRAAALARAGQRLGPAGAGALCPGLCAAGLAPSTGLNRRVRPGPRRKWRP